MLAPRHLAKLSTNILNYPRNESAAAVLQRISIALSFGLSTPVSRSDVLTLQLTAHGKKGTDGPQNSGNRSLSV